MLVTYELAQGIRGLLDWKAEGPESIPFVIRDRRKILTDPRVNSVPENGRKKKPPEEGNSIIVRRMEISTN
jgi:hypothetical protein